MGEGDAKRVSFFLKVEVKLDGALFVTHVLSLGYATRLRGAGTVQYDTSRGRGTSIPL